MSDRILDTIRDAIKCGNYNMTHHAVEEMAEDGLEIFDVESAIFTGYIKRIEREDYRGSKYVIEGKGADMSLPV